MKSYRILTIGLGLLLSLSAMAGLPSEDGVVSHLREVFQAGKSPQEIDLALGRGWDCSVHSAIKSENITTDRPAFFIFRDFGVVKSVSNFGSCPVSLFQFQSVGLAGGATMDSETIETIDTFRKLYAMYLRLNLSPKPQDDFSLVGEWSVLASDLDLHDRNQRVISAVNPDYRVEAYLTCKPSPAQGINQD